MVSKIEKQSFGDVIIAAAAQTAATAGGGGGGGGQNQMTLQQQAATKASVSSGAAAAATTGSPGAVSLSASPIRSSAASPPSCPLSAAAAGSGRVGSPSPPVLVPQIPINNFNNKNCETISPSKRTPQQRNSITTTPSAVATDAGGDSSSDEGSSEKITDDVPPPLLLPGGGGHSNSPNYPQQNSGQSPPPPPPQHPSFKNFPHQQQQIPPTSFSLNKNEEFGFLKPPECLVFKPNDEEFKNPLAYISKIRSVAEKYGICKIQPPKTWTPPFTVDVDKLRFTPRVQRLNELEAKTRVKLNFLDQIAKFWELQGSSLKIPMVERKALDLYTLHRIVQEEGGMEQTTKERKWSKVAQRMGYPAGKSVGTILKGHYERILHPFDIFTIGKSLANETAGDEDDDTKTKLEPETTDDQDYKPHGIVSRQQITPPNETTARRSKRFANSSTAGCGVSSYNYSHGGGLTVSGGSLATGLGGPNAFSPVKDEIKRDSSNDLSNSGAMVIAGGLMDYRRTQISGAGPKMAGNSTKSGRSRMAGMNAAAIGALGGGVKGKKQKDIDPLAKYICHICNRGDIEEAMLLCDGCDDSYHTFCLIPPLNDIPKGDWRCPKCVVEEVSKPVEAFGFEQAQREYTLQQFGEMADQFKADYFNMSVHLVPTELVEREFWRIVSSIDEDVTVEYGADLHTMDHGSGFPTKSSLYLLPGDQEYAESSWNLNNLPLLEESILGHINADISGMKVPWMYVGMCFATFCWHNEDHWSYSINYLHWGEPKTWYGVPGCKAEAFEETMKSAAPELFQSQPDLLHQLVTIMNPNILMNAGVPVYRTDQHAGEFVITFPRAYHAGFNQGYNFAEAVNFAPADWMKMGRECINHYSTLRRFCVFSHDELVCKMALDPDKLNLGIATACYLDMAEMVDSEKKLRKSLLDWGVTKAERSAFELIPDDERQCESCKTTCFLSAVTCTCTTLIVCLRHYTELCECSPDKHTLKYRYTLDELPLMLKKLKVKAESFENWLSKVRDVLDPNTPTSITLEELQELAQEAEDKKFPSSILLERLNSAVLEAEKCVTVIQQLDINKMRTRTRNSSDAAKYKLTLDELEMFVQEIDNLCCVIQEGQSVRELQALGKEFLETAKQLLSEPIYKVDEMSIEKIIEEGSTLCIELPEIKLLKDRLQQVNWYNRVREFRDAQEKIPIVDIHTFLKEGLTIAPDAVIEKELYELQEILMSVEDLEVVAKRCFESDTQHELPEIELLLERADDLEGELPSQAALKDAVKKAKEWLQIVEILQSNESYPYFHTLESLVNRGKNIPFQLEELKRMEEHLSSARSWKERTSRTFLKKQTTFNLLDVLSPRSEAVMYGSKTKKKSMEEQFTEEMSPVQMVNAFKNSEEKEILEIRQLRKQNMEKNPTEDKYCKCKRKFQGLMYQCQLCKDWFHETCVPPPKNTVRPRPSNTTTPTNALNVPQLNTREKDRESKYLCQSCMRSRRPRLETILSLLVSLQRLPIRLPEGEALQCLTERAMNWQDRVRQAFSTEDVVSALAMLSNISQKNSATSAGIDAKLAADDEYAAKHANKRRSQTAMIRTNTSDDEMDTSSEDEGFSISSSSAKVVLGQHQQQATLGNSGGDSSPSSPTKIEHAYSVPVPQNISSSGCFSKSISGLGAPLSKADMPLITLAKATRESLELLMMEGDLMEVSLDETLHIWRILNAAKPSISDLAYIHYKYKITPPTNEILVTSNKKKRRSEENFTSQPAKRSNKNQLSTTNSTVSTAAPSNAGGATGGPSNIGGSVSKIKRGRKMKMVTKETDAAITLPVSSSATSGIGMPEIKKRKRGKKAARQEQVAIAASTSDDDEECSAANCARPSGREVDWVQCDGGCNKWFHMYCVGLDKDQIKPDDDFICKRCKKAAAVANFVAADLAESVAAVAETTTGERSPYTNEASERGGGGGEEEDAAAATTGAASNSGLAASNTNLSSSSNGAGGGGEESDTIVTSGVGKGGRKKANIATTTTTTATNSSLLPNSIKNNSGSSTISHSGEKKIDCDFDTKNKLEEGDGVANDDDDDEDDNGEDNIDETTAPTTRRSAAAAAAVAATATTTGDVETNSSSTTMSQINMGGGGGGGGGNDASNPTTTATKNPRRRKRYRAKGKKQKNRTTPPLPKKIKTTKKQRNEK